MLKITKKKEKKRTAGDPIILLLNLRSHNQHNYKEMKAALVDGQIILQTAKLALVCTKKN